jgi:hypothetical protein
MAKQAPASLFPQLALASRSDTTTNWTDRDPRGMNHSILLKSARLFSKFKFIGTRPKPIFPFLLSKPTTNTTTKMPTEFDLPGYNAVTVKVPDDLPREKVLGWEHFTVSSHDPRVGR